MRVYKGMKKWQDYLRDSERKELEIARALRDQAKDLFNRLQRKLKSRAESRMRNDNGED